MIGGGDFGRDRLIPDLVRAEAAGQPLALRNPGATRPFQHVLDVVAGYLVLAEELTKARAPEAVNFGPAEAEINGRGPAASLAGGDRPGAARRGAREGAARGAAAGAGQRAGAGDAGLGAAVRHAPRRGRYRGLV